ncbi:isotrichodermin C-15 hydroxylase [Lasiosphaeria hispida]|uniref:Isotrichodermin C-15 hydroxylase n=1 Tax=Lasiosphaeria hispida TaxID=260671 RepID=A0AAJ0HKJ1_9PEZI|nr:isotrichodermin C-15 hydroxylase [Lasiosphaeria hispida]
MSTLFLWEPLQDLPWLYIGVGLAALLILAPITLFIYNIWFHPLAGYPGPLLYRGSNLPKIATQLRGNITMKMHELHEIYGPVVRVAPWELSYITAETWKDICLSRRGKEPMNLNTSYGIIELEHFGAFSILWQASHAQHARHRRVMAPAFSDKAMREQEPVFHKYVDLLVQRMHENQGTVIDICTWFHFTTFDMIGDLAFGEPFDCLKDSQFHPWIHFILSRLRMMLYGQIVMTMGYGLGEIVKLIIPKNVTDEILKHVALTKDKVDRRREKPAGRLDFMTHILEQVEKQDGINLGELYANAQILVMAGSETSGTLLTVAAFQLMKNPASRLKLEQEIRTTFALEGDMTFASISQLPYLNAVINESLRIQPPIPAAIHRFVPKEGAIIDGKFVAGGTDVHVSQWAANHSESNFTDPHLFVPERWLGDERYKDDNRDVFQPFSVGKRNCIGRSLALMETRLIIARLVWSFDMEIMAESLDWDIQKTFILYDKGPLKARLTKATHTV